MEKKIKHKHDFILNLVHGTEVMCIILLESSDTGQTRKSTLNFIPMKDTKICKSDWKISKGSE